MIEALRNKKNIALSVAAAVGLAALAGCTSARSTPAPKKSESICIKVGFGSAKGGPGLLDMDVYPILKPGYVASNVTGEVISGNDTGVKIVDNSSVFAGSGEFPFSWDTNSVNMQSATVRVSAEVAGMPQLQACPDTTLHFNPTNFDISPTYK